MKRYSEYKDSGVKWIGEIPGHWKICRTRYLCNINTGDKDTVMKEDNGKYPFYVRSPKIERINTFSYDGEAILMAGDGVGAGKVFHYANGKFDYHQRVYNMHNICGVSGKFMFYFIRDQFHYAMEEKNAKSTVDSVRLPWLKAFPIAIPAQEEQEAIVTYLDTKVAKIDEYISIAEKKIAALEELKQTIIAEAVTRGIHKDVLMKDSGVKWIGMIPEHWKVMRLSQIAYEHFISNKKIHHQNLLSLSYGQIIRKDINGTNGLLPASFDTYQVVEEGNIILRLTDLQNDHKSLRVGLVKETGIITSAYLCLAPKNMVYSKFLYFQLHACDIKKVFYSMGDGLRQSLNYDGMRKLASVIPPLPEQQEIVTYIEAKVAKIDQLCQAERSQIEKLKEYKQRLISDVVTGKVKVTND